ncbi:MAG TPA: helix-turn-helix transcriptional regulator [Vicinamibacterales bacterium]|jgi:transcriptional regulator with XRE-family HTH domain
MSERDSFGPRLRRERERRGISLETLAERTNVSLELWAGLESNDFSKWPGGLFARAFVRDYARVIGLDAAEVIDDFCRLFPVGDRRALPKLRAQAELIGHEFEAGDDRRLMPGGIDRRGGAGAQDPPLASDPAERQAPRRPWWPKKASVP